MGNAASGEGGGRRGEGRRVTCADSLGLGCGKPRQRDTSNRGARCLHSGRKLRGG